jgi:UDP-glucose 4-epimerase
MKAIVFGGSGFVGSHVADALTAAGHCVTIFDCRPSRFAQPSQRVIAGNILDERHVMAAVADHDVVYNFAGLADLDDGATQPAETVRLNVLGCVNVLDAARAAGVARCVLASTIYVYSDAGGFYRASKQAAEMYVEEYQRRYGLDYTILRYGTLYGRRATEHNSVHRYLRQALDERRITACGTGDEVREYIHVEDAALASVRILDDEFRNQHVILTGHHAMRVSDLVSMIREIVGPDVTLDVTRVPSGSAHYRLTPYTFRPKLARKLVSAYYVDLGQGLVDCLAAIAETRS